MADSKPINWAFPFPNTTAAINPLQYLTSMAKANDGYYPVGENGLWHGGVHFDNGTGAVFDQSSVRCIADGEVIAYRIDETYPITECADETYQIKRAPFSTGFVLVKHTLQAPAAATSTTQPGSEQAPPKLTLYSLYMHLLDWKGYDANSTLERPPFWNEALYTVKSNAPGNIEPKAKGRVVILDTSVPIKAGDLIGHLGTYQNHDSAAQLLLHLEVFSCQDVPGFIAQSRAWARSLPNEQKTLLKVYKDASKLITHRDDIKADNPPKPNDSGRQIGIDLIIPQALLDALPVDNKLQVNSTGSHTPSITHWWRLDGLFADQDGNPIDGWLAEQDLITTRHSPWEWQDFQLIEDTGTPVEKLAYAFNAQGILSDAEKQNYGAQISAADGGPIVALARLHEIVDTNQDNVLTNSEIRCALGKPWHAQVLGQLISKYESEWLWNKSKWDELDPLLAPAPGEPNPDWEQEKQRIEKLSWWADLAGKHGISEDGKAWHFQPVGLIGSFIADQKIRAGSPTGKITFDAEGNDISDSPYFSRVIHWPGNDLSGVTLGRGYDMGFRSHDEIYTHMTSSGITQEKAEQISQAYGLRGDLAKQFVRNNKDTIGEITKGQQVALFEIIYPGYVTKAISNYNHWTGMEPDRVDWELLHFAIKDVLVDFVYQGFTKGPNPMKAGMSNDLDKLIYYIENTQAISQYEKGRHRANYLRSNR